MSYVVTFGEILMRLSPQGIERVIQSNRFDSRFSGAEANVAISLAYYGNKVKYVTRLPNNVLGDAAENEIRKFGVDTSHCVRGGERLGIYFTEKGSSYRASTVLYDRIGSSFYTSNPQDYDWKTIFQDCEWFHISGINLLLNDKVLDICKEACSIAKQMNVKICFDINYRSLLAEEAEALEKYYQILPYVDLLVGNESEIAMLAGRDIPLIELNDYENYIEKCHQSAVLLQEKYDIKNVAASLRKLQSASETSWSGIMLHEDELIVSGRFEIKVSEVIGCGDAFVAGLLHYIMKGKSYHDALSFAVAASCLKHTIEGDYNLVKEAEVEKLMYNYTYGIVQR